ncbi:MAG: hypothetical protein J0H07_22800 [Sphingobacteriales bacterium]|nr:hypothetical protein [Sphingobacteriales bacterium]
MLMYFRAGFAFGGDGLPRPGLVPGGEAASGGESLAFVVWKQAIEAPDSQMGSLSGGGYKKVRVILGA